MSEKLPPPLTSPTPDGDRGSKGRIRGLGKKAAWMAKARRKVCPVCQGEFGPKPYMGEMIWAKTTYCSLKCCRKGYKYGMGPFIKSIPVPDR